MPEVLVKFDEPMSDPGGAMYFAQAAARQREDGLWEGWLEFIGLDESARSICSDRETTQPNRADLEYWAQGLTRVYLQGALARAGSCAEPAQRESIQSEPTPRESSRNA
jgi:hypothetical protein